MIPLLPSSSAFSTSEVVKKGPAYAPPALPFIRNEHCLLDEIPYLITTEIGQTEALRELSGFADKENGVYLGFSYEFNYNILSRRRVKHAFICDINKRMHSVYKWTEENILRYERPDDFLEAFKKEIESRPDYYIPFPSDPQQLIKHYEQPFMWTSDAHSYSKIRALYQNKLITHVSMDLVKDSDYFEDLNLWARENGYVFDCIYVSNIPEWAQRGRFSEEVQKMKNNLLKLISQETILIDAKQEEFEKGEPKLRLTSGIISESYLPSFLPSKSKRKKNNFIPQKGKRLHFS